MFLSTNNGSNWMTINDGLTDLYVDCIAINGNNIYIGTDVAGIYISTNDGTNWTSMNQGLYTTTSGYLFSLKILNSYLFAGTYDHSCWRFNLYSPNLISPLNNSVGNQINLNLIWSKRIDALKYNVILSTDSLFTSIILNDSTLTDTIKNVTSLSFLTNYFWKVRIKDSTGWRPFSNKWKFTTTAGLPLNLKVYLEGFWNGTNQVSDTVNIYLAGSLSPHNLVDSQKVVLNSIGTSNPAFTKASSGSYYIIVKHRNHLETWSGLPQTFVSGVPLSYDFTTDSTKAFGMNMKKVGSVWVLIVGDANQDGSIDAIDVTDLLIPQFGNIGYLSCDFNGDGSVDADDVPYMIENYGLTKVVPTLEALPLEIIRQKQIIKKQELNNTFKKKKNINLIKNE